MLKDPSKKIRGCYPLAGSCARKVATQTDPNLKRDLLSGQEPTTACIWVLPRQARPLLF
jgi:hypothetical protein